MSFDELIWIDGAKFFFWKAYSEWHVAKKVGCKLKKKCGGRYVIIQRSIGWPNKLELFGVYANKVYPMKKFMLRLNAKI